MAFNFIREIPLKIKNLNRLQFYKRNPFKIFGLKFYMKNPFKINQLAFNFTKEIPLKFCRKKNGPWNFVSKIPSRTDKLETIFEKNHPSLRILKIIGATPQLVQNLTPIWKLFCTFLYKYFYYSGPPLRYLKTKKRPKNNFLLHFHFTRTGIGGR